MLVLYLFYNLAYLNKVFPNTYFAGEKLSGNKQEVTSNILTKISSFEDNPLFFEIEGQKVETDLSSLGIEIDKEATVGKILELGRTGKLAKDLAHKLKAPFAKSELTAIYQIDFSKFAHQLDGLFSKYETKTVDATIVFRNNKIQIEEAVPGRIINRQRLATAIFAKIENLSQTAPIITLNEDLPKIKSEQATKAFEKVQNLSNQQIVLSFGRDIWHIGSSQILDFLKFYHYGQTEGYVARFNWGQEVATLTWVKLADSAEPVLDVSLDGQKIDNFIANIAKTIDRPTVNARLSFENGKVTEFTPAQDGQKLDRTQTLQLLLEKISIDNISGDREIIIALPIAVTLAKIESEEINSLGVRELIGRGISYFAGSIPNRAHNIALGSSLINGALIPPGQIFSFNSLVGPVSPEQGFKQAYVIAKGRTVLDDGGGICQVSTTVFRAALNSGLPIVKRTAHAYRVSYYEQRGFKPGFDATIWSPIVDFQFKNDTNNHILVQVIVNRANAKLQIDIYGTSDGRQVELTEPVVSNLKPPPSPKYENDPTLPKGTVKQVDFAAYGAKSVFTRKVYRGNELLIDESFNSNFRPWQAVYLVGTGG